MNDRNSRGFSLVELLVVIAIIGALSLVSVPAFINYQRTMYIRGALRTMATDLRTARQLAISRNVMTRIEVTGNNTYELQRSDDNGETWQKQAFRVQEGDAPGFGFVRTLDSNVRIASSTFVDDATDDDGNSFRDVDFRSDGTVWDNDAMIDDGLVITLLTDWEDAGINRATVTISVTGQLTTVEDKV